MKKRITCIALFDNESLEKLKFKINMIDEKICKVPCIEGNRENLDTLPYHLTLLVWNIEEKDKAIEVIRNIKFEEIKLNVIGVNIKESINDSWNLYFEIEQNDELYKLQKQIYNRDEIEKYNTDIFITQIT